jgi:hypothetical protein
MPLPRGPPRALEPHAHIGEVHARPAARRVYPEVAGIRGAEQQMASDAEAPRRLADRYQPLLRRARLHCISIPYLTQSYKKQDECLSSRVTRTPRRALGVGSSAS